MLGVAVGLLVASYTANDLKNAVSPTLVFGMVLLAFIVFCTLFFPVHYYVLIPLSFAIRTLTGRVALGHKVINYDPTGLRFEQKNRNYLYEWNRVVSVHYNEDLVYVGFYDKKWLIIPASIVSGNVEFERFLNGRGSRP